MRALSSLSGIFIAVTGACAIVACGGSSTPSPPGSGNPPPSGVVQVTGTERIGWDQSATSVADLQSLSYVVFVDGVQGTLNGASCNTSQGSSGFPCSAPLPPLTNGQHTLQLAAVRTADTSVQSDKSAPLTVLKVGTASSTSAEGREPLSADGLRSGTAPDRKTSDSADRSTAQRAVVIADQLHAPTALAAAPDGRVFIAELDRILIVEHDALRPEPALVLAAAAASGEAGFPDLTLDPGFSANHLVWSSQIVEDSGRRVVRVTRYTEAAGNLGESAIVAQLPVGSFAGRTRIRVGPDGRLYVSVADLSNGNRDSTYEGAIVRLERDGTTPRDNPSRGPVLSSEHGNLRAIAWPSGSTEIWDVESHDGGSTIEALPVLSRTADAGRTSDVVVFGAPRRFAVSAAPDLTSLEFLAGTRLLTAIAASPETQSLYRLTWSGDRLLTPVPLLAGRFGTIREVSVAADGSVYAATANASASDGRGDVLIRMVTR